MAMDEKKKNHPIYSKLRKDGAKLWSFSSVSNYENCPHEYYLGKILKKIGCDNIYTKSGTLSHDILEEHYETLTDRQYMYERFNKGMLDIFCDGYRFMNEKIEVGYMENMRLYFQSFIRDEHIKKCEEFISMPLCIFDSSLKDNFFNGWADAILERDGCISIGDFKSSTIFTGKDLVKKSKQLILYSMAYEFLYNKRVKSVFFDFLKYADVTYKTNKGEIKNKIVERKNIYTVENLISQNKAYVFVELNDDIKKEALEWLINNIKKINSDSDFTKNAIRNKHDFYCKNLCGQNKANNCKYM